MVHSTDGDESEAFLTTLNRFSEWHRLKRSIAWILRLKPKQGITDDGTRRGGKRHKNEAKPLGVEELLKLIQSRSFPKEIGALQKIQRADSKDDRQFTKAKKSEIRKSGTLFCLHPFLDKDGLIRVGGRLGNSQEFEENFRHPVILPKKSFIARRGSVREIRSDQGTNIVGAETELKKALEEMDHDDIQRRLSKNFSSDWVIKWKRNPPAASHMGGVWECQIRSVRSILSALMREYGHVLDDESLRTLMAEVECIINSRPLTVPSSDPGDLDPLTPSHLLTMKSKIVMPPPGNFQKADVYLRRRWKRVQYLSNVFWSRWRKEYVQTLQERVKWNNPKRNFQRGDLVLIADDRVPRNQWNMARVVDSRPDSKGQI